MSLVPRPWAYCHGRNWSFAQVSWFILVATHSCTLHHHPHHYPGTFAPRPFQQSVLNSNRPHTSSLPSHPICTTVYRAMRVSSFIIYDYIKTLSVGKASSLPSHSRSIAHRSRHEMQPVIVQLYCTALHCTVLHCTILYCTIITVLYYTVL